MTQQKDNKLNKWKRKNISVEKRSAWNSWAEVYGALRKWESVRRSRGLMSGERSFNHDWRWLGILPIYLHNISVFCNMIYISICFRAAVGDGRFISLVVVNKTGNSSGNTPAEWICSDLFSWISYEFGHERCMHWYRNQSDPNIYTGKTHNLTSYVIRP